jgi:hypothetical protein
MPPPPPPRGGVSARRRQLEMVEQEVSDDDHGGDSSDSSPPPPSPPQGGISRRRAGARKPGLSPDETAFIAGANAATAPPAALADAETESSSSDDDSPPPPPPRPAQRRAKAAASPARTASPSRSIIAGQPEDRRTFVVSLRQEPGGDYGVSLDADTPSAGRRAVVVTAVEAGSGAAQAGVLPGDELLAVAGFGLQNHGLQQALAHLRSEERRLQQLHGGDGGGVDWRFYRPAGAMPQLPRTKSPVRFSPARVQTFPLSPREEEEKRKHWHAIHGASEQQYAQQEREERAEQRGTQRQQQEPPALPNAGITSLEDLFTSAAVVIQCHERGRQDRVRFDGNPDRVMREHAVIKLQSARRGQVGRRFLEERKQAQTEQNQTAAAPLPAGWERHVSRTSGSVYYHNIATGENTYARPQVPAMEPVGTSMAASTPVPVAQTPQMRSPSHSQPEPEPEPELLSAATAQPHPQPVEESPPELEPESEPVKLRGSLRVDPSVRAAAQAEHAKKESAVVKAARQKFDEMDTDGNGTLDKAEVGELSRWALSSFLKSEDSLQLTAAQQAAAIDKLMSTVDRNRDGKVDFDEFVAWFTPTCKQIQAFRANEAKKKAQKKAQKKAANDLSPEPVRSLPPLPRQQRSARDAGNSASELEIKQQQHAAATKLQAATRGRQDRVRYKRRMRAKRRHEEAAATKIGAHYRGHLARKEVGALREAARERDLTSFLPSTLLPEPEPEPEPEQLGVEAMVAQIYAFCDPDHDGWIGKDEYMYCACSETNHCHFSSSEKEVCHIVFSSHGGAANQILWTDLEGIHEWGRGKYTPEDFDEQWVKECTSMGCEPEHGITWEAFSTVLCLLHSILQYAAYGLLRSCHSFQFGTFDSCGFGCTTGMANIVLIRM